MRSPRIVIGLAGPAGVGKSTLADRLAGGLRPEPALRLPFAKPLRDMLVALGVPVEALVGDVAHKQKPCIELLGKTARHAMRTLGTEWGRKLIGDDLWVAAWERRLAAATERYVVVDDVRFANESAAIRAVGGVVVRLRRKSLGAPAEPNYPVLKGSDQRPHPSEAGLSDDDVDVELDLDEGIIGDTDSAWETLDMPSGQVECGRLLDMLRVQCEERRRLLVAAGLRAMLDASGAPGRDLLRRVALAAAGRCDEKAVDFEEEIDAMFEALNLPRYIG